MAACRVLAFACVAGVGVGSLGSGGCAGAKALRAAAVAATAAAAAAVATVAVAVADEEHLIADLLEPKLAQYRSDRIEHASLYRNQLRHVFVADAITFAFSQPHGESLDELCSAWHCV